MGDVGWISRPLCPRVGLLRWMATVPCASPAGVRLSDPPRITSVVHPCWLLPSPLFFTPFPGPWGSFANSPLAPESLSQSLLLWGPPEWGGMIGVQFHLLTSCMSPSSTPARPCCASAPMHPFHQAKNGSSRWIDPPQRGRLCGQNSQIPAECSHPHPKVLCSQSLVPFHVFRMSRGTPSRSQQASLALIWQRGKSTLKELRVLLPLPHLAHLPLLREALLIHSGSACTPPLPGSQS